MSGAEIRDLAMNSLRAHIHLQPILGRDRADFSLDLEFKVDSENTNSREVYIKQARPYLN